MEENIPSDESPIEDDIGDADGEFASLDEGSDDMEEMGEDELSELEVEEDLGLKTKKVKFGKDEFVEIESDDQEDGYSEFDSEEIENENPRNPHGFIDAGQLDTFKKPKRERIQELKDKKEQEGDKVFNHKDKKGGGSTNKAKLKSKPFAMTKKKKLKSMQEHYLTTKSRIK